VSEKLLVVTTSNRHSSNTWIYRGSDGIYLKVLVIDQFVWLWERQSAVNMHVSMDALLSRASAIEFINRVYQVQQTCPLSAAIRTMWDSASRL